MRGGLTQWICQQWNGGGGQNRYCFEPMLYINSATHAWIKFFATISQQLLLLHGYPWLQIIDRHTIIIVYGAPHWPCLMKLLHIAEYLLFLSLVWCSFSMNRWGLSNNRSDITCNRREKAETKTYITYLLQSTLDLYSKSYIVLLTQVTTDNRSNILPCSRIGILSNIVSIGHFIYHNVIRSGNHLKTGLIYIT